MTEASKSNLRGAALSLLAFAIFASHDVIVKFLGASYAPFQLIFFSVVLSFPWVIVILIGDKEKGTLRPVHPWWSLLRTLCILVAGVCAFYAFSTIPLAQVYAILFAGPLIITVLSIPILGETVGLHRWSAVVVGLIGVIVALRPGSADLELGHLAAIVAAFAGATASVTLRKIGRDERSAVLMLFPLLGNFVVMGALLGVVYEPMPFQHLLAVALMAVLAVVAGLVLIAAYKAGVAAIVAPMQYSQIIWATLFGAVIFAEYPDTMTLAGAGIVILSGLYIVAREALGGQSANTPVLRTKSRMAMGNTPRTEPLEKMR